MINRTSRLIVCSILSTLAVLGTLFCVTSAFSLSVQPLVLILVTLLSSTMFTAAFQNHKLLLTLIPSALLIAFIIITGGTEVLSIAVQQLLHDILTKFSTAYKNVSFTIPQEPAAFHASYYTMLFSLASYFLSLWMAWGIGYRSCLISIAGTLPFLLICVIINDTPPSVFPLIMLVTVWITVLLSQLKPDEAGLVDATRLTLVFLASLLVFGCIGIAYPKDDTSSQEMPEIIEQLLDLLPDKVQDLLSRDSNGGSTQQLGADTADILDLTKQGVRSRTDDLMMQLNSTEAGVLYLRATAKDIYTGTTWESTDEASTAQSEYAQTSLGSVFGAETQAAVQIKNYRDNTSIAFVPYGFISCTGTDGYTSDLRINTSEADYIIYYWPGVRTLDLTKHYTNTNTYYDAYVQEHCLSLPDGVKETLYQLALDYGYNPDMTQAQTIAWVASFIRSVGTYKLDVSCQPANEDFAVYFLTQSKEGYCVHFATAACAMYRALGIPSRYASGYRVSVDEAESVVDITDNDTHAWAEVYISGLGWIPIETTPGFEDASELPELSAQDAPTEPEEESSPDQSQKIESSIDDIEEVQPSEEPEPSASPSPSTPQEETAEPSPEASAEPSQQTEAYETSDPYTEKIFQQAKTYLPYILWGILIFFILAVLFVIIRSFTAAAERGKLFRQTDRDAAVIAMWAYLETLEQWNAVLPDELHDIALKAKFSQHKLSEEEYSRVYTFAAEEYQKVYTSLTTWKRLRFTYFSAMKCTKFN